MAKLFQQKNSPKIYSTVPESSASVRAATTKFKTSMIIEKLSTTTIVVRRLLLLTLITASSMAILVGLFGAIYSLNQNSTKLKLNSFNITSVWPTNIPIELSNRGRLLNKDNVDDYFNNDDNYEDDDVDNDENVDVDVVENRFSDKAALFNQQNKSNLYVNDKIIDSHSRTFNQTKHTNNVNNKLRYLTNVLGHQNLTDSTNNNNNKHRRIKRGVISLASMIRCITRCKPLSYKDYGCYCGFQGEGYPVDPIDRCCLKHDLCYTQSECHQALVYFVSYKWICHKNRRASCGYIENGSQQQLCAYQLCECDRKFAKCLSQYRCPKMKPSCRSKRSTIWDIGRLFF